MGIAMHSPLREGSGDCSSSHKKFEEKYGLPFTLLSDPEKEVIQAYDVWKEKKNYSKCLRFGREGTSSISQRLKNTLAFIPVEK